ncbi:MAG: hypothetical protein RSE91_04815 [Bacilli bacterium]
MPIYSEEHQKYLKTKKHEKHFVVFFQITIIILFLIGWEALAHLKIINTFLTSSPSLIFQTLISLKETSMLFSHIGITVYETIISFMLATVIGFSFATILWYFPKLAKIMDPYLTVINSLPKVALGPLIIIWVGASINSIIFMALMISAIISIINTYNGFIKVDKNYLTLLFCWIQRS